MKKHLLIILLLISSYSLYLTAQEQPTSDLTETTLTLSPSAYRVNSVAFGPASFRDFATSPLIYRGLAMKLSYGKVKVGEYKESGSFFNMLYGLNAVEVEEEKSTSLLSSLSYNYTSLYTLKKLSNNNWTYKIGGMLDVILLSRTNPKLVNNGYSIDIFPTLFGSFKIEKNFRGYPFFLKRRPIKDQRLSLRIDVGLVNMAYRNGFSNAFHAPIYNNQNVFENYSFHAFSGFQIRTALDYILYANEGRTMMLSYIWEGLRTGNTPDRFAMLSNGLFQIAFLQPIVKKTKKQRQRRKNKAAKKKT